MWVATYWKFGRLLRREECPGRRLDAEKMATLFAAARDGDVAGGGVDAVLDEFGDGFEGILLRKCDDIDGVPIIANAQAARIFHVRCMVAKQGEETTKYSKHTKYRPFVFRDSPIAGGSIQFGRPANIQKTKRTLL